MTKRIVRIALIQHAAGADPATTLDRALSAMDRAAEAGAQLVAFPELAVTTFFPQFEESADAAAWAEAIPGPTSERIAARAGALGLVTVFNMYERDDSTGNRYDSSPVFDADGTLLGVTRMVHITEYACFHEQRYYDLGNRGAPVYQTKIGRIGVAICYDRHYPEYMRALGVANAEVVVIPQAGAADEWPEGLFEAEVQTAAFQNGYFAALCNRVGQEDRMTFSGESFVSDPSGRVVARAAAGAEDLLIADLDLGECRTSHARKLFWRDRRPGLYRDWLS